MASLAVSYLLWARRMKGRLTITLVKDAMTAPAAAVSAVSVPLAARLAAAATALALETSRPKAHSVKAGFARKVLGKHAHDMQYEKKHAIFQGAP